MLCVLPLKKHFLTSPLDGVGNAAQELSQNETDEPNLGARFFTIAVRRHEHGAGEG